MNEDQEIAELFKTAKDHFNKGDYDQAIKDYDKAIELKPNYSDAYYNRGIAYDNKGNYDQAIKDYNKAIELNPNHTNAYNNRGLTYDKKGDYNQAIKDYSKAIELKPNYSDAYNNRGNAYYNKGDHDQAIKDYNKAIDLNTNYENAYYNRGVAYGNKGNYDQAIKDFEKALKIMPSFSIASSNLQEAKLKRENKNNKENIKKELRPEVEKELKEKLKKETSKLTEDQEKLEKEQNIAKDFEDKAAKYEKKESWLFWATYLSSICIFVYIIIFDSISKNIEYWHISPLVFTTFMLYQGAINARKQKQHFQHRATVSYNLPKLKELIYNENKSPENDEEYRKFVFSTYVNLYKDPNLKEKKDNFKIDDLSKILDIIKKKDNFKI